MIKIIKINIGSFKLFEDTSLDITKLNGVVSVLGKNNDIENFSANSVGKSTLIDTLLFALYGKSINTPTIEKAINVYSGIKPNIEVELEVNDDIIIIQNNVQTNKLRVYENGVLLKYPKKADIYKYIETKLGINYFMMSNLIYLSANNTNIFAENNVVAQSKFIQTLLNLEYISGINKKASDDLKAYKGEYNLVVKEVTMLQNNVLSIQQQMEMIPEEVIPVEQYSEEISNLSGILYKNEGNLKALQKILDVDKKKLKEMSEETISLKAELKFMEKSHNEQLALISEGRCSKCGQETSHIAVKISDKEIKELRQKIEEYVERGIAQKKVVEQSQNDCLVLTGIIVKDRAKLNEITRLRDKSESDRAKSGIKNMLKQQLIETLTQLKEANDRQTELENKVYILELITHCSSPKGFVKERIALFLKLYNIELQTLGKELLGGLYKLSILKQENGSYELIINDGTCDFSYSSLSSGFKARLDIILTLALSSSVKLLTGNDINILYLDELLSSIDESGIESIESLLESIRHKFPEKVLFVVSHNQGLRDTTKLTIERTNNISKFVLSEY